MLDGRPSLQVFERVTVTDAMYTDEISPGVRFLTGDTELIC